MLGVGTPRAVGSRWVARPGPTAVRAALPWTPGLLVVAGLQQAVEAPVLSGAVGLPVAAEVAGLLKVVRALQAPREGAPGPFFYGTIFSSPG